MTRTEIIALAKQCGAVTEVRSLMCDSEDGIVMFPDELEAFFHAAQALEREACAKVCDEQHDRARTSTGAHRADACAAAIRNRGTK